MKRKVFLCVSERWWLSNIGSRRGADEEFSVFTNLRLWIHIAEQAPSPPPETPFLCLFTPRQPQVCSCHSEKLLGITTLSQFLLVLISSPTVSLFYLSPSGMPHISFHYLVSSHMVFSLLHNPHLRGKGWLELLQRRWKITTRFLFSIPFNLRSYIQGDFEAAQPVVNTTLM